MKKPYCYAVIVAGCGNKDGSEIQLIKYPYKAY